MSEAAAVIALAALIAVSLGLITLGALLWDSQILGLGILGCVALLALVMYDHNAGC